MGIPDRLHLENITAFAQTSREIDSPSPAPLHQGECAFPDFIDPSFIGAQAISSIQRARQPQLANAPKWEGARFRLIANWRLE